MKLSKSEECRLQLVNPEQCQTAADVAYTVAMYFPRIPQNPFPPGSALFTAFDRAAREEGEALTRQEAYADRCERGGPSAY